MRHAIFALLAALALGTAPLAWGQGAPGQGSTPSAYRVQFFLTTQAAGQPGSSRSYALRLSAGDNHVSVDTGDKVPIKAGNGDAFTYENTGVRLDCLLLATPRLSGALHMHVGVSISAAAPSREGSAPVISAVSASLSTTVPLGHKLTIAAFEDPETHTHYQLAVQAEAAPQT